LVFVSIYNYSYGDRDIYLNQLRSNEQEVAYPVVTNYTFNVSDIEGTEIEVSEEEELEATNFAVYDLRYLTKL